MMETERLRLLDTFTDGEGEQTTVYGSRRAEWRALCGNLRRSDFCVFCRNYLDFLLSP